MGLLSRLFGEKINEAAQHQLSGDILSQQHHAITDILKEIMNDLTYNDNELSYFSSFVSSHVYLVAALAVNMRQDDTNFIVDWYMKNQFKNKNEFNQAVERHKLYMPTFHAAANNENAYMRLASQFLSYSTEDDYGVETVKIGVWLSTTLHPTMLKISQLLKEAGKR